MNTFELGAIYRGILFEFRWENGKRKLYQDGKEINPAEIACPKCGMTAALDDPDPCWGKLPGVSYACCGHGRRGYISFENGVVIRFRHLVIDPLSVS